jgi:linoleoyl-CoA desaturase
MVTFNNKINREFSQEVKKRVNAYFEEQNISKHANAAMVIKTAVILGVYWGAYALIMLGGLSLNWMWALGCGHGYWNGGYRFFYNP